MFFFFCSVKTWMLVDQKFTISQVELSPFSISRILRVKPLSFSLSLSLFFSDFFLFSFLSSFSIGASLSGLARAAPSLSRAAYLRAMPESEFIRAIRALLCIVTARSDTKESVLSMHPETVGLVYNVDRHECHDRDEQ